MDDEKKYSLLAKVLSGEASEEERAELEAAMSGRPGGKQEWEDALSLWQQTDEVLATAPRFNAAAAWEKVRAGAAIGEPENVADTNAEPFASRPRRIALPVWTRYAVAAAAVLILGLFILKPFGGSGDIVVVVAEYDNTPVVLADGSKVALRAGSRLEHPKKFSGATRGVKLEGEGFFEVTRDAQHPFIVSAGAADVTVLGTSFDVQSGSAQTVVTVSTGKVKVEAVGTGPSVTLTPGERGTVSQTAAEKDTAQGANHLFWKTGVLEYKKTPLSAVVADMNALFSNAIKLDAGLTAAQQAQSISIRFENQSLEEMLSELCAIAGLRLQKSGASSYLITAK